MEFAYLTYAIVSIRYVPLKSLPIKNWLVLFIILFVSQPICEPSFIKFGWEKKTKFEFNAPQKENRMHALR